MSAFDDIGGGFSDGTPGRPWTRSSVSLEEHAAGIEHPESPERTAARSWRRSGNGWRDPHFTAGQPPPFHEAQLNAWVERVWTELRAGAGWCRAIEIANRRCAPTETGARADDDDDAEEGER